MARANTASIFRTYFWRVLSLGQSELARPVSEAVVKDESYQESCVVLAHGESNGFGCKYVKTAQTEVVWLLSPGYDVYVHLKGKT